MNDESVEVGAWSMVVKCTGMKCLLGAAFDFVGAPR